MDLSLVPIWLLFVITVIFSVLGETYKAHYIKNKMREEKEIFLINGGTSFVCAVAILACSLFSLQISTFSLIIGILFGAVSLLGGILSSYAIKAGPYSLTRVIISLSTVFTALSGFLFWGEPLGWLKIVGIVLMFLCVAFAVSKEKDQKKINVKWFIFVILAMVFSASVGITQKIHQASEYRNELYGLLFTAFAFGAVCSFLIYFYSRYVQKKKIVKVENKPDGNVANKKAVLLLLISVAIISGVSAAANNVINLYLSGKVQSAIFFPIVNGVPLVMYVITSFVLFKEKLSKKQWMGVLLGLASVLCLCLS